MKKNYQSPKTILSMGVVEQVIATSPGSHLGNGSNEEAGVSSLHSGKDVEFGNLW